MIENIFRFCSARLTSLTEMATGLFEFLDKGFESPILGGSFVMADLMFGPGIWVVLGVLAVYFLIP